MKIAFFTDAYLDLTGGIVNSVAAQKRCLEKMGHTVYLFSTGFHRTKEERQKLAKQNIYVVPSCFLCFRGLTPISRRPKIIERWLKKNFPELRNFDIFHAHYESGCSIAGLRLGRELGIPTVQTMHGREDVGVTSIVPFGLRTFAAVGINWFHSWYLPHDIKIKRDHNLATDYARANMWTMMVNHANYADAVLTPSKHFKDKLVEYGVSRKITVIPNGFLDELMTKKCTPRVLKASETMKIIWHSRVSAEKRIMPFLKALTMVHGDYELHVYGGGGDYRRAVKYARKHNLNAIFYNTTPFIEIYENLKEAHLDVLVSYNFDTFGMTLIEAESVGVPTLICDPDMKEILPAGSYVLSKNETSEKMAEALQDILDNPEKIQKMSEVLIEHRAEVAQSKQTEKLLKIYDELRSKK